jgi:hypothetical protein
LAGVTKWRGILTLGWQFVVDCHETGDRLRKSGKLRILKIPIGKSGRMVKIGKISPESGKLAGMHNHLRNNNYDVCTAAALCILNILDVMVLENIYYLQILNMKW